MNAIISKLFARQAKSAVIGLLLVLFAWTLSSTAQTYRGGITGTVTDNSGASIAGAAVTATEDATNTSYKAISTSAGEF